MTKQEILEMIGKNPAFHIATIDDNKPRVRGVYLYSADESGIVFHSGKFKALHKQIEKNPQVEMCFNDFEINLQVRVNGKLDIVEDDDFKMQITEHPSRQFLQPWLKQNGRDKFLEDFSVYRLKNGEATWWTLETNFEPKKWIELY